MREKHPYSGSDFGNTIALTPGVDSTEEVLICTSPMPWHHQYGDEASTMGVQSRDGVLHGCLVLSTAGCQRSARTNSLPPVKLDNVFGARTEQVSTLQLGEENQCEGRELWFSYNFKDKF